jgi:hypothetical protein
MKTPSHSDFWLLICSFQWPDDSIAQWLNSSSIPQATPRSTLTSNLEERSQALRSQNEEDVCSFRLLIPRLLEVER